MSDVDIVILGVFVADATFHAARPPQMGETVLGTAFALGPGGKGSNQAVAAGRLNGRVALLTRLGDDAFADIAYRTWQDAGVQPVVVKDTDSYTGAASIFIEASSGDNAIIVCPGAASRISVADVDASKTLIKQASVFVTQLEQPLDAAQRGLEIARSAGVRTILNPAPAASLSDEMFQLCDFITPNETEAAILTGVPVESVDDARNAADILIEKGVGHVVLTLGEKGALLHGRGISEIVPANSFGPIVETTGAGDAFNGAMAVALARGDAPIDAVAFGCAVAGISVTRAGTASSMPLLSEVEAIRRG